jgi:hypothetical protein
MSGSATRKVSFWRLGLGLILTFLALKNLDTRNVAPEFLPSNSSQWIGYYGVTIAILVCGFVLIFFGIRKLRYRPPES